MTPSSKTGQTCALEVRKDQRQQLMALSKCERGTRAFMFYIIICLISTNKNKQNVNMCAQPPPCSSCQPSEPSGPGRGRCPAGHRASSPLSSREAGADIRRSKQETGSQFRAGPVGQTQALQGPFRLLPGPCDTLGQFHLVFVRWLSDLFPPFLAVWVTHLLSSRKRRNHSINASPPS